ncbi:energy-coupled thiamine transporter ThiT [Fusibacter bizertensis]|uniref:Energy-coupled thiamine transporter ThiT n=1 Tax=Fusibacter bizertensis TaxID=1488331 RepID=A0ABT6NE12_9FIRM|nr:energy-coupled thiamine transporter ThiT [Fusibacter bizertensis]MDH8678643.1 energy-coupled thiamine transporter ThiT [Fusibacter bizertensis]
MERKSSISTKMLVEGAMMIAIATVLSFLKMKTPLWVNGGSVTAGSMIPLLVFAYRWGGTKGMFVSAVYGLLQFMIEPYAAHPLSVVLDYPLAFGMIGLFGYFANKKSTAVQITLAATIALGMRFVAHFLSGFIFFASYAPEGTHPVVYSLIYNGSYMLPELVISVVIFFLIRKPVEGIK